MVREYLDTAKGVPIMARNCRATASCHTHNLAVPGIRHAFAATVLGGMPREEVQLIVNQAGAAMLPVEAGTRFLDDQTPAVIAEAYRRAEITSRY